MAKKPSTPEITDDQILELAQEIRATHGGTLTDAMIQAEHQLTKSKIKDGIDCEFTMTVTVKPKVAKFFREQFPPTARHTTEERIAIWLAQYMNMKRGRVLSATREPGKVGEGEATTVRHSEFLAQTS